MKRSDTLVIIPPVAVSRLKQQAKKRQRETGRPHHELLDEVAKEAGFNHWHQVAEAVEYTRQAEQRFRSGLYVLMDIKEGLDLVGDDFDHAPDALALRYQFIFDWMKSISSDVDDDRPLSAEEFQEAINDDYVLLRYTGDGRLPSKGKATEWFREHSFWAPSILWVRGEHLFPMESARPEEEEGDESDSDEEEHLDREDEPMPVIDEALLKSAFGSPGKAKLILNAETMERFEIIASRKRAWYWCLHCERAYPQGSYRQRGSLQMCPYSGCGGDTVMDAWSWARVAKENPGYPATPELGKAYPLYGSSQPA